jgi:hypothetical protein
LGATVGAGGGVAGADSLVSADFTFFSFLVVGAALLGAGVGAAAGASGFAGGASVTASVTTGAGASGAGFDSFAWGAAPLGEGGASRKYSDFLPRFNNLLRTMFDDRSQLHFYLCEVKTGWPNGTE